MATEKPFSLFFTLWVWPMQFWQCLECAKLLKALRLRKPVHRAKRGLIVSSKVGLPEQHKFKNCSIVCDAVVCSRCKVKSCMVVNTLLSNKKSELRRLPLSTFHARIASTYYFVYGLVKSILLRAAFYRARNDLHLP